MSSHVLDPIKILICGGYGTGKTTILRRLCDMQFPESYEQTNGLNVAEFMVQLKSSASLKVVLIDVGAELIQSKSEVSFFSAVVMGVEGAMLVVDGNSLQSMKESDAWIEFLSHNVISTTISKYLLVNKADQPNESRVVAPKNLDLFINHTDIDGWALTVGHCDLGDYDLSRGCATRQKPPEDILKRMLIRILIRRQSNIYKLIPADLSVEFGRWTSFEYEDLDHFVNMYS